MMRREPELQAELRDLAFPVLLMQKRYFWVHLDALSLTAAWAKAVKAGNFNESLLIDSNGRARRVGSVVIVGSIGSFFGFDIFLNRNVRLAFQFKGDWFQANLDEIQKRIRRHVRYWWQAADPDVQREFDSYLANATSFSVLIQHLVADYGHPLCRTR